MTQIVVEPDALSLLFPKAASETPAKVRLIVQTHHYDLGETLLYVTRLPNVPTLVIHIDLENELLPSPPQAVPVNVSLILDLLLNNVLDSGLVISIIGTYDGDEVTVLECTPIETQLVLDGGSQLLAQMASLQRL